MPDEILTPQHLVDLQTLVRAYTIEAAYANFLENVVGSLKSKKFADLIVLDQDIFQIDPHQIVKTQVLLTLFEGKIVYQHSSYQLERQK